MQELKKTAIVVVAVIIFLAVPVTGSASSGVSADEQRVLDTAYEAAVNGGAAGSRTFQSYYAKAESWLAENELTEVQCDTLAAAISEASEAGGRKTAAGMDRSIAAGNTVKQIELDWNVTVCVITGLAAAFIACSVILNKRGLFTEEG